VIASLLLVAAALYAGGVVVLARRGVRWSPGRSLAFLAGGLGTIAIATMSSLGAYDDVLFSVHMAQHMALSMVAPVFLALGAPVTLALRALPATPRRWLLALLHSRFAKVVTFPLVTVPVFVGTLYVLYFTSLYVATLEHPVVHDLLHVHFVLAGCLFFWPLLGVDPIPGRLPHWGRLVLLLVTLPVHAWLGIALMSSSTLIAGSYYRELGRTWGPSLLADQHLGGGILWSTGDLVTLLYVAVLATQWVRADEREARRLDRHLDRVEDSGHGDDPQLDALAAYNAYLARLNEAR
jgi:putative copper resistance protein D